MKKTVIIGVTGGIAAFKACQLTSDLIKLNYDVEVIMTKNATEFINPLTFESLIKKKVIVDTFDRNFEYNVKHISLSQKASCFIIVPATANVIAKVASGIADDMLTTTFLATTCPKLICPAMNTNMYENAITQNNLNTCRQYGMQIIEPDVGLLACGDIGKGKLAALEQIIEAIEISCYENKALKNKGVLVTAGPTIEAIDPVRFISNHSSGKMGYNIAKIAALMGAEVTLISGPTNLTPFKYVQTINVESAKQMFEEVKNHYQKQDFIIQAAAVGDFKVKSISDHKIKKTNTNLSLELVENEDILAYLGSNKTNRQLLCGFAMETENLIENATQKLIKKNCDLIIANDLTSSGAGFKVDTNIVTMITKDNVKQLDIMSKEQVAEKILLKLIEMSEKYVSSN